MMAPQATVSICLGSGYAGDCIFVGRVVQIYSDHPFPTLITVGFQFGSLTETGSCVLLSGN